jgi:hypothetical protein
MPFVIEPEMGETIILEAEYAASEKSVPFAFGITNRAIFLPAKKTFAMKDPWYFRRVPLSDVREVRIRRLKPHVLTIVGICMVVVGLYAGIGMFNADYLRGGGKISGWPIAIFVGGLILPFIARGRFGLVVTLARGKFRWKPPLVVDRPSKENIAAVLAAIVQGSRSAGIHVLDERSTAG